MAPFQPSSRPRFALSAAVALMSVLSGCGERELHGPSAPDPSLSPTDAPSAAATNVWVASPDLPTARQSLAAGEVNGVLYAIGGTSGGYLTTVEAYTPGASGWATMAPLPQPRASLNGTGTINGVLYVAGGFLNGVETNTLFAYTPSTNTWATLTSL